MLVAVVGTGISGSSVLETLVNAAIPGLEIDVYESADEVAKGFPYAKDAEEAIMNEHAFDLSLDDDDPDQFVNWLRQHYPAWQDGNLMVPRAIYGNYLQEQLLPAYQSESVRIIKEEVIDLQSEGESYRLFTSGQPEGKVYAAVFLAIGHPPYKDPYGLKEQADFIQNPFPLEKQLQDIQEGDRIAVVGSSLTGLDIMKYIMENYDLKQPLVCLIQNEPFNTVKFNRYEGEIHTSFTPEWWQEQNGQSLAQLNLDELLRMFHDDLKQNAIDFDRLMRLYGKGSLAEIRNSLAEPDEDLRKIRLYIAKLTRLLPDIYNALTPPERDRFHEDYEPTLNHFRVQMPAVSLEAIIQWVDEGRLIFQSDLVDIHDQNGLFQAEFADGSQANFDLIINATGFDLDPSQPQVETSLIQQLYRREIILPHYRTGVTVTWPHCQIISAREGIQANLFLLGSWISGVHYANNSIRLCRLQAQRVANYWLESLVK